MSNDPPEESDSELIYIMTREQSSDRGARARVKWEGRKFRREEQMLSMTETLVESTNKVLIFSRRALWIAIMSCIISLVAIFLKELKELLSLLLQYLK
jgi:hypothetical protein